MSPRGTPGSGDVLLPKPVRRSGGAAGAGRASSPTGGSRSPRPSKALPVPVPLWSAAPLPSPPGTARGAGQPAREPISPEDHFRGASPASSRGSGGIALSRGAPPPRVSSSALGIPEARPCLAPRLEASPRNERTSSSSLADALRTFRIDEKEEGFATPPRVQAKSPRSAAPVSYPEELADFADAPPCGGINAGSVKVDLDGGSHASIGDRIEGIRACLESRMGTMRFQKLYRSMESESPVLALDVVGEDQDGEAGDAAKSDLELVAKLVACENGYFS